MANRLIGMLVIVMLVGPDGLARQKSIKPSVEDIIRRFAAAESENKVARNNYTFTQDVDIRTVGPGGAITGRFHRVSDIVYDDRGARVERITYFPPSTLSEISVTKEDLQDLAGVQPFALTLDDLPKYQVDYVGKERVDELDTHIFEVRPRRFEKDERYFQGRIWVDDQDFQIVKAAGRAVPEVKDQRFPAFETYRQNIDDKYWFPVYVYVDDVLEFKRSAVHVKMVVRYTNYKKFGGTIRIGEGTELPSDEDLKDPKPKPVKPPPKP